MTIEEEYERRKNLTFAQAEGLEPLPSQLAVGEISSELRALLWSWVYKSLAESVDYYSGSTKVIRPWLGVLRDRHVRVKHKPFDEFKFELDWHTDDLKSAIFNGGYSEVIDLVQWLLRHNELRSVLSCDEAVKIFWDCRAAYRIFGHDDVPTIMPIASAEEAETVKRAFEDLQPPEWSGAKSHLQKAGEHLTAGHYADSIRESIHAVEATARKIGGTDSLSGALQRIRSDHGLHRALEQGFKSLYGFTSDEKGIRHPLIDDGTAKVDEADAVFMIGACAAFVSFLVRRSDH